MKSAEFLSECGRAKRFYFSQNNSKLNEWTNFKQFCDSVYLNGPHG